MYQIKGCIRFQRICFYLLHSSQFGQLYHRQTRTLVQTSNGYNLARIGNNTASDVWRPAIAKPPPRQPTLPCWIADPELSGIVPTAGNLSIRGQVFVILSKLFAMLYT